MFTLFSFCVFFAGCGGREANLIVDDEPNPITIIEVGKSAGYSYVTPGIPHNLTKQGRLKSLTKQGSLTELQRLHQWVQECLSEGAFHSVHIEYNEVRIDPTLWSLFTIEQKQNVVLRLSAYFTLKGSTGRVTVLSNRNDKKLATYGSWRGIRILE